MCYHKERKTLISKYKTMQKELQQIYDELNLQQQAISDLQDGLDENSKEWAELEEVYSSLTDAIIQIDDIINLK